MKFRALLACLKNWDFISIYYTDSPKVLIYPRDKLSDLQNSEVLDDTIVDVSPDWTASSYGFCVVLIEEKQK